MDTPKPVDAARGEVANIGKSVVIKGELSGSEDLYIDGQVDGAIEMKGNRLTIGPNGRVKANVNARAAVIQGKLEGNIKASDRVDLKQSAIVLGDIATQRISIEDGAYFKGGVDIQREGAKEAKVDSKTSVPAAPAASSGSAAAQAAGAEPRK
jgi:cytoskeletal protein CcmA (bactofilin family)